MQSKDHHKFVKWEDFLNYYPERGEKANSLLIKKPHMRPECNDDEYECTVINVSDILYILLGVGSSHSMVDVRMVLVFFFHFASMHRPRTYGRTSSEVLSGRHSRWQTWTYVRKPEPFSDEGKTCHWGYTRKIFTVWYTLHRLWLYWGTNTYFPVYASYVHTLLLGSFALLSQMCCLLFCGSFPEVYRWVTSVLHYFFIRLAKSSRAVKAPAHKSRRYLFQGDKLQPK